MLNYEVVQWVIQSNWNGMSQTFQNIVNNMQQGIPLDPQSQLYLSQANYAYSQYKQMMRQQQQMVNQQQRMIYQQQRQEVVQNILALINDELTVFYINNADAIKFVGGMNTQLPAEITQTQNRVLKDPTTANIREGLCEYLKRFSVNYWLNYNKRLNYNDVDIEYLPIDESEPNSIKDPCVAFIETYEADTSGNPVPFSTKCQGAIITLNLETATIQYRVKPEVGGLTSIVNNFISAGFQYDINYCKMAAMQILQNYCPLKTYYVKFYFNPYSYTGLSNTGSSKFGTMFFRKFNIKNDNTVFEDTMQDTDNFDMQYQNTEYDYINM